jgi:L-amino acid N-acyltransferase YncA
MWVAPFARGHAVGDSLVNAVIEWAREQEASRVTLAVSEGNECALALYRRHGFIDAGATGRTSADSATERKTVRSLLQAVIALLPFLLISQVIPQS